MEAKVMPVNKHNNMLAKQFLLSTMRPNHPNHSDINHIPPQLMKDNLVSRYSTAVKPLVPDGTIDENLYKKGLKKIHTGDVYHRGAEGQQGSWTDGDRLTD